MAESTAASKDHLTALPSEILQTIISLLFPTHIEDKALLHPTTLARLQGGHPLDHLAATSNLLRLEVNDWAHHFLVQHQTITKFQEPATITKFQEPATITKFQEPATKSKKHTNYLRNPSNSSKALLTFLTKKCIFCGTPSQRRAILMNGLGCCAKCDRIQWPEKITKTQALAEFDLKKFHLLPHHEPPGSAGRETFNALGIARLRYGTYFSCNVPTTMFLRRDVERLAARVHGDVEAHLAERARGRKKRVEGKRLQAKARQQAGTSGVVQMPMEISDDEREEGTF